jgi:peptidoglycan/xylan/chitin deacetylase (PgdA/CDA1 family)
MNIPILSYHSISDEQSSISISTNIFEKQIIFLKKLSYETVNFDEIDPNKKNQIILTFDDGYKDILINALPILKKYNFKATCFFVTNLIGKNNNWDNKKENYKIKELMNPDDIKKWYENGMSVQSHSHNHLDLTKLSNMEIINELEYSKKYLKEKFNIKSDVFCYPFGKVNRNVYEITKKIYKNAVTTNRSRYNINKHNRILIPRIDMGKKISLIKLYLKLKTFYEDINFKNNELYL